MKELHDNKFDAWLTASLSQNIARDAEAFLSLDVSGIVDHPRIKSKILKRARKKPKPLWVVRLRIAAIACLIAVALAFTACMCIPKVRKAMWNAIIEWNDGFIRVEFTPSDTEGADSNANTAPNTEGITETPPTPTFPSRIESLAATTYLPQGYHCTQTNSTLYTAQSRYSDSAGKFKFVMTQSVFNPESRRDLVIDSDDTTVTTVSIHSFEGVLVEYHDTPKLCHLTWLDASYLYTLYGYFESKTELLKIAESIRIEPPATPPYRIEMLAKATWLPSGYYSSGGYHCKENGSTLVQVDSFYYAPSRKKMFQLSQSVLTPNGNDVTVESSGDRVTAVSINGFEGKMIEYLDKPGSFALVWQDASYLYSLVGKFDSANELLKIAKNIKIE